MSGKTYLIASSFFMIMYLLVSCSQQSPFVQDMETYSFDDLGTWTIYIPASWPERYKRENEFPIISSIAIDSGGAVWFATTGGPVAIGDGVYRFDGKNWVHFSTENGLPSEEISSMVAGPNGIIWFGTHCCGIAKFDGKTWDHFTVANGLGSNDVRSIAVAPDGKLWVGTSENGLSIYDGIGWKTIQDEAGIPRGFVGDIFILPNGNILFSTSEDSFGSLIQYDGKNWMTYPTPWEATGKYVMDVAKTSEDDIWFALETVGAHQLSGEIWDNYGMDDGLVSNQLICVDIASDGSVWFGTANGISRYDGSGWESFLNENEWGDNWISAVAATPNGTIWFGSNGKIIQYVP